MRVADVQLRDWIGFAGSEPDLDDKSPAGRAGAIGNRQTEDEGYVECGRQRTGQSRAAHDRCGNAWGLLLPDPLHDAPAPVNTQTSDCRTTARARKRIRTCLPHC